MTRYDLALIGFGGVNRALAELIAERGDTLEAELGFALRVVAITDLRAGSLVRTDGAGIDLAPLLAVEPGELDFSMLAGGSPDPRNEWIIREVPADIVAEATFTNPVDGEPALSHVRWAVEAGKHVCTTNKGPVALHGGALKELARRHGVRFEFEGTVMSGTPVLRTARRMFGGLAVHGFEGVMNGTSNYVLGRVESGLSFADAVAEAQALGYAEADPTADIEGHDVQLKVMILAGEVLGADLSRADVPCTGLSALTADDVRRAAAEGLRWKLVGSASRRPDGTVEARVAPVALPTEHALAGVSGPVNAVAFHTDLLGTVTVAGPGARQLRDELHLSTGTHLVTRAQDTGRALRTYDAGAYGQGAAENFVTAIRFFFRYAVDAGLLARSPADAVEVPRRHPSLRRPLTSDELTQIWDIAVGTGMDPELDGMILTVLRHTACRRSGLLGLALTHLDLEGGTVLLTEKYSDTRLLPMSPRLIADLLDFAHGRGSSRPADPVFRYRNGQPLTRRRFNSLFDRIDRHTTFTEPLNVSAHWIRHTTLADITAASDLRVANAFAGHSPEHLGVTGIYTKVTFEDMHDAYWAVFGSD